MSIHGKACIVTGAGRGIGRAIALRLTSQGANVMTAARTQNDLAETVKLAAGHPGRCVAHNADITQSREVDALIGPLRARVRLHRCPG